VPSHKKDWKKKEDTSVRQRLVLSVMVALVVACVAGPARAQVLTNALPAGVTVGEIGRAHV